MPIVPATPETISAAGAALRAGALVAFPTETVYGLGANALDGRAVARIYEAKGRPQFNPLIAHCARVEAAERIAVLGPMARRLADAFWPGPLTLVLQRRAEAGLSDLVTAGLDTVGVRVPDHPIARALLEAAAVPVAAPSANRSGHVSPTTAEHVLADLGEAAEFILDGGPTTHGLESTILDATTDDVVMLRAGAIPAEAIEAVLGRPIRRALSASEAPVAPGQLASHYAPRARLRLGATEVEPGEALLAFGALVPAHKGPMINLSPAGDIVEAAAGLFAALRALDATGAERIAAMPIPKHGLGEAINDRLMRAAAPRP